MVISYRDALKVVGIIIVCCCAVFVCTLFLNYNLDLCGIEGELTTPAAVAMYYAQIDMGRVTVGVTGGCLVATSAIMLVAYIKNYIDSHGRELGILKAIGHSRISVAKHFVVFGLGTLVGCIIGYVAAYIYLPAFYRTQNADGLFPDMPVTFHPELFIVLTLAPAAVFSAIAVLYAFMRLKTPVLDLMREKREYAVNMRQGKGQKRTFLKEVAVATLKGKKSHIFFVAFSAFCFSAMVQMAISMTEIASQTFSWMIGGIGLILAFTTIFMALSGVVRGNAKAIAMMHAFGYSDGECRRAILGAYRPISYIGFVVGSVYQYALLKLIITFVFAGVDNIPDYNFSWSALLITFAAFVLTYELIMYVYSLKLKSLSLKSLMLE